MCVATLGGGGTAGVGVACVAALGGGAALLTTTGDVNDDDDTLEVGDGDVNDFAPLIAGATVVAERSRCLSNARSVCSEWTFSTDVGFETRKIGRSSSSSSTGQTESDDCQRRGAETQKTNSTHYFFKVDTLFGWTIVERRFRSVSTL